jgi:hydroxypyruvate isomerase
MLRRALKKHAVKLSADVEDINHTTTKGRLWPKFAANLTMLFNEVPSLTASQRRRKGVRWRRIPLPYDFEKGVLAEQLHQYGLTQVLHNLPAGNWGAGERGIAILPNRVAEFRDGVSRAVEYCQGTRLPAGELPRGIVPEGADPAKLRRCSWRTCVTPLMRLQSTISSC